MRKRNGYDTKFRRVLSTYGMTTSKACCTSTNMACNCRISHTVRRGVWDYFRKKEAGVAHLDEAEAFTKVPSTGGEPVAGWFTISDPPNGTPPEEERSPPPTLAQPSDRSGTSVD